MYGIYIFLFIVLLLLLLILKREPLEGYNNSSLVPNNNSCLKILYEKKWLDSGNISQTNNNRKAVAGDMEVARVPLELNNSVIYPDVNACVIGTESINLFRGLDPNSCVMRGVTPQGRAIYHELTPVKQDSFVSPKGCMLTMNDHSGFMTFLDNAYQMKNYDVIKSSIDQNSSIVGLTNQNIELQNRYSQAIETANLYKSQLDQLKVNMGASGVDRVLPTCKDRFTNWNEVGDWNYNYLDRHNVACGPGEMLTQFQLQTGHSPKQTRYQYTCCALDTSPVKGKLGEGVEAKSTAFADTFNWNTISLANHNVSCPGDSVLKGFKLQSQYNGPLSSKAKIDYTCGHFNTNALPGRKLKMQCKQHRTNADSSGKQFDLLDRHNIKCDDDEALKKYSLKSDGANLYYEYTCCKPILE